MATGTSEAFELERTRMLRDIGRRLDAERERQGVTRASWPRRGGLSQRTAQYLVRGERDPRLSTLLRAAVGLGLKLTVSVKRPDSADTAAPEREGS